MNKTSFSILLVLILGFGNQLWACTCVGEASARRALRQSDFVFMGKVIEAEDVVDSISLVGIDHVNTFVQRRYTFEVKTVFKGKRKTKQVQIITGLGNGDCGFEFAMGREYVVYADKRYAFGEKVTPYLRTDVCKRTTGKVEEETRLIRRRCWGK